MQASLDISCSYTQVFVSVSVSICILERAYLSLYMQAGWILAFKNMLKLTWSVLAVKCVISAGSTVPSQRSSWLIISFHSVDITEWQPLCFHVHCIWIIIRWRCSLHDCIQPDLDGEILNILKFDFPVVCLHHTICLNGIIRLISDKEICLLAFSPSPVTILYSVCDIVIDTVEFKTLTPLVEMLLFWFFFLINKMFIYKWHYQQVYCKTCF